MTRPRGKLCPCGHEKAHHTGPNQTCVYGHTTVTGGCVWCRGWGKKPRMPDDGRADPLARVQLCVLDVQTALNHLSAAVRDAIAGGAALRTSLETSVDIRHVLGPGPVADAAERALESRPRGTAGDRHKEVSDAGGARNAALTKTRSAPVGEGSSTGDSQPTGAVLRILTALTQHGPCTRRKLALVTGYSGRSGSFASALAQGRARGWIVDESGLLVGKRPIVGAPQLPRGAELLAHWMHELGVQPASMLDMLAERGAATREELAVRCGYSAKSGSFASALAKLRALDLVDDRDDGCISLAKELWP